MAKGVRARASGPEYAAFMTEIYKVTQVGLPYYLGAQLQLPLPVPRALAAGATASWLSYTLGLPYHHLSHLSHLYVISTCYTYIYTHMFCPHNFINLHLKFYGTILYISGYVGFKEGAGQHPHGSCPTSLGIMARPGPNVNVRDSERLKCYLTFYIVYHAISWLMSRVLTLGLDRHSLSHANGRCVSVANTLHWPTGYTLRGGGGVLGTLDLHQMCHYIKCLPDCNCNKRASLHV